MYVPTAKENIDTIRLLKKLIRTQNKTGAYAMGSKFEIIDDAQKIFEAWYNDQLADDDRKSASSEQDDNNNEESSDSFTDKN